MVSIQVGCCTSPFVGSRETMRQSRGVEGGDGYLSKDFEQKCIYSENIIRVAAIALTLRQIH